MGTCMVVERGYFRWMGVLRGLGLLGVIREGVMAEDRWYFFNNSNSNNNNKHQQQINNNNKRRPPDVVDKDNLILEIK